MWRLSPEVKAQLRTQVSGMAVDYTNKPANAKTVAPFGTPWIVRDPAVEPAGTFYQTAFDQTKKLLDAAGTSNKRAVIFLTDGAPEDMGADADVSTNTAQALKALGVPVFLLALKPDNAENAKTFDAVSTGFTQANQRVIPVNSAFDIARAMASVLTYLKPSYYLDVVNGNAGTGSNTTVFITNAVDTQQIAKATFVFASNDNKQGMKVTENSSPSKGKPGTTTGRFRSFAYDQPGGLNGKWEFTADKAVENITSFVFVKSALEVTLRYPDETASESAVMAFPSGTSQVLVGATIKNLPAALNGSVRITTVNGCEDPAAKTMSDDPAQQNGLNKNSDTVFWATIKESKDPINVGIGVKPANAINLRRCYVFLPSSVSLPLTITSPSVASPKLDSDGALSVETSLPETSALSTTNGIVFTQPISTTTQALGEDAVQSQEMTISGTAGSAAVGTDPGVPAQVRVVVPGIIDGRPVALFVQKSVTPSMSCLFELEREPQTPTTIQPSNEVNVIEIGVITSTKVLPNALICKTVIRGGNVPIIDTDTASLKDADGTAQNPDMLQFEPGTQEQTPDGKKSILRYPFRLGDVTALPEGIYTYELGVRSGETTEKILLRFERPKSTWSWDLLRDGFTFADTIDETAPTTSACTNAYPVLSPDTTLNPNLTVSNVYAGTRPVGNAPITAMIQPDSTCPGGYRVIIDGSRLEPGDYTFNLSGSTSDMTVPLDPPLQGVKIRRGAPLVQIVFPENRRVDGLPDTYTVDFPIWPVWLPGTETQISYSAIVTHTRTMPVIDNPLSETIADVEKDNSLVDGPYDFSWTPAVLNTRSKLFDGYLVETDLPWFRWPGKTYDVTMSLKDPRIVGPESVVLRVPTHSWWDVISRILLFALLCYVIYALWRRWTKAYSGSVRFMVEDAMTPALKLHPFGNAPLAIVQSPYGGLEDVRVTPLTQLGGDETVLGTIRAMSRDAIDVDITSPDLNPEGKSPQRVLLGGKRAIFGEDGVHVSYRK
jgi:hypothetical protein